MTYLDTSVALAHILGEERAPPASLWNEAVTSSRLLEYEIWTRLHATNRAETHGDAARELISRIALIELAPPVLLRALEPFPVPLRTLDALHLASIEFLRSRRVPVTLASYDTRMLDAARAMGIPLFPV